MLNLYATYWYYFGIGTPVFKNLNIHGDIWIAGVQNGTAYDGSNAVLIPRVQGLVRKNTSFTKDQSVYGEAFKDVSPPLTTRMYGSLEYLADSNILNRIHTSLVGMPTKYLSVGKIDNNRYRRYQSACVQSFSIKGSVNDLWLIEAILVCDEIPPLKKEDFYSDDFTFNYAPIKFSDSTLEINGTSVKTTSISIEGDNGFLAEYDNNGYVNPAFVPNTYTCSFTTYPNNELLDLAYSFTTVEIRLCLNDDVTIFMPRARLAITEWGYQENVQTVSVKAVLGRGTSEYILPVNFIF